MQIIDTRQTYFDDAGKPLSGGRLRFFAFGTTTPVAVYADNDYVTSLGTVVALTSAGWTSTGIYAQQSVTCHVDRYLGLDEYGVETYEQIKVYDYLTAASSGGGSDSAIVDTIADLREVVPTDGLAVTVKGYYDKLDCFPRTYIWDANSTAVENLGTVFESSIEPNGRWILGIEGPYVDCRIFGVMSGLQTTNSAFAQFISYCATYKRVAYFPTGNYYLLSGGSITATCAIKADKSVRIFSNNGTYTLTVTNPNFDITDTFAGTNLIVILNGNGWQDTIVPITTWNTTAKGYDIGNAYFNLKLNNGTLTYTWGGNATYKDIILDEGVHYVDVTSYPATGYELRGNGTIHYANNSTMHFSKIRTSLVYNYVLEQMERTYGTIYLDTAVTLSAFDTSAYIWAEGSGSITTAGSVKCTGGLGGSKKYWIAGSYGINCGDFPLDAENWANGNGLVSSYNISNTAFLDMKGYSTTGIISKSGRIKNGVIYRITNAATWIDLENMTVNGDVESASIKAFNCSFVYSAGNVFPNMISSNLNACSITTGAGLNVINSVWNEVNVSGDIKSIGGGARLTNVNCTNAVLIPNSSKIFANFAWIGGSITGITLDASQMSVTGEAICYNTKLKELTYLTNGIDTVNGSTKKWAITGHYNVDISDNEKGRMTRGSRKVAITRDTTSSASTTYWCYMDRSPVFVFRKESGVAAIGLFYDYASVDFVKDGGAQWEYPRGCQYVAHINDNLVYCDQLDKSYVGIRRFNDETQPATGDLINFNWVIYK